MSAVGLGSEGLRAEESLSSQMSCCARNRSHAAVSGQGRPAEVGMSPAIVCHTGLT